MGCCQSRIEREEIVSRCKARKKYAKQLVEARKAFSTAHSLYILSLRNTGSALLHFAGAESILHHYPNSQQQADGVVIPSQLPSPPPPPSVDSGDWTSVTVSPPAAQSPPPPPPPPQSSWDFWDPFVHTVSPPPPITETQTWENVTTNEPTTPSTIVSVTLPSSAVNSFVKDPSNEELAVVISTRNKVLGELVNEIDEYFLKAADSGWLVSFLLESSTGNFSSYHHESGKISNPSAMKLTWGSRSPWKLKSFCSRTDGVRMNSGAGHCSTLEKLREWEKKLYHEVKNSETMKVEHEQKLELLRNLETKRKGFVKVEKTKKEISKLESKMEVSCQAIETISDEIVKLRETELYPQMMDLVKGLMCMWRSMYACHQVQSHVVHKLKYLNAVPSGRSPSEIHRQSVLQLELEVRQWGSSFCHMIEAQRAYIESLTGWLRLSLFHLKRRRKRRTESTAFYSLCEEWHLSVDRIPERFASEGIECLRKAVHAIAGQQAEEQKQARKLECALRELEKKTGEMMSLEVKYSDGPSRCAVEGLKEKVAEEKKKHQSSVTLTRTMTLRNLQAALPQTFQSMTAFSSACMQVFESAYSHAKAGTGALQEDDVDGADDDKSAM